MQNASKYMACHCYFNPVNANRLVVSLSNSWIQQRETNYLERGIFSSEQLASDPGAALKVRKEKETGEEVY